MRAPDAIPGTVQDSAVCWQELPPQLVGHILRFLPPPGLAAFAATARANRASAAGPIAAVTLSSGLEALRELVMWCTNSFRLDMHLALTVAGGSGGPSTTLRLKVYNFLRKVGVATTEGIVFPSDHAAWQSAPGPLQKDGVSLDLSTAGSCALSHESLPVTSVSLTVNCRYDEVVIVDIDKNRGAASLSSIHAQHVGSQMARDYKTILRNGVLGPFLRVARLVFGAQVPPAVAELEQRRRQNPTNVEPLVGPNGRLGTELQWTHGGLI